MMYPRILIDLKKIEENVDVITSKCSARNIWAAGVTKVFCADRKITDAMINGGVTYLADSRMQNLKKFDELEIQKYMLRLPMMSEVEDLVRYCDVSLNSELETIKAIDKAAGEQGKVHKIILMADLGDLREGIFDENELVKTVGKILELKNIKLKGLGTNLTCYGGVLPTEKNLNKLINLKNRIEKEYDVTIDLVSGGNSSSLYLIDENRIPEEVNMLRIGEAFVLGRETTYGNRIEETHDDAFILEAQIIELKEKPSLPIGELGMDAFGNHPTFEDKGIMKRAICAVGRQDIDPEGLISLDEKIDIIGASSDHLILDMSATGEGYKLGDIVKFKFTYGSLLRAFTSDYVAKVYI